MKFFKSETGRMGPELLVDDNWVLADEHKEIARRRLARGAASSVKNLADGALPEKRAEQGTYDTIGLSLSGGGIRAAAFAMGAMQGLEKNKVMSNVDYLSTVSGGGYAGVPVVLNYRIQNKFVFLNEDEKTDTPAMRLLRDRADYLKSKSSLSMLRNFAIWWRGVVANMLMVAPVLLLLACATLLCNPTYGSLLQPDAFGIATPVNWGTFTITKLFAIVGLVMFAVWSLTTSRSRDAGVGGKYVWAGAFLIIAVAVIAFLELQSFLLMLMFEEKVQTPFANCAFNDIQVRCMAAATDIASRTCPREQLSFVCNASIPAGNTMMSGQSNTGGASTLIAKIISALAALSALQAMFAKSIGAFLKNDDEKSGIVGLVKSFLQSRIWLWIGSLLLPVALWLLYLLLVYWGLDLKGEETSRILVPVRPVTDFIFGFVFPNIPTEYRTVPKLYLLAGLILLGMSMFLSANGNSPHRLYRDRLGMAFCFLARRTGKNGKQRPCDLSGARLSQLGKYGPYLLVNTALNVQADKLVNQRGRNADFFLFSQLYTGSRSTGYARTCAMEKQGSGKNLDAATAMAVSGAAFSSNMGSETIRLLRFTLAFFNVRLGYWFPNPNSINERSPVSTPWFLLYEVLGLLNTKRPEVYLSDGGHLENLGLYELLRRRCKLIIAIDAEADPEMKFGALAKVQRYARIDLGARITIKWSKISTRSLLAQVPDGKTEDGPHCALGTIDYQHGEKGYLLYVKSSVTGDENDYVRDYNRRYSDFPHQTTGDQFFSEEQYEAYRALGFHCIDGLLVGEHRLQTIRDQLEHLVDEQGAEDCAEVAKLLGVARKPFPKSSTGPQINHIKIVSGVRSPVPTRLRAKSPPRPRRAPVPPKRGR